MRSSSLSSENRFGAVYIPPTRTNLPSAPFVYRSDVGFDGSKRKASCTAFHPRVKW